MSIPFEFMIVPLLYMVLIQGIGDMNMKKDYQFITDQLLIWQPKGILDYTKIIEFVEYIEDVEVKKKEGFKRFIDLSYIEEMAVQYEEISQVAKQRRQHIARLPKKRIKVAFLVNHASKYGMARMYESLIETEKYDVQIFQSVDSVAEWLNVDSKLIDRKF